MELQRWNRDLFETCLLSPAWQLSCQPDMEQVQEVPHGVQCAECAQLDKDGAAAHFTSCPSGQEIGPCFSPGQEIMGKR
jgi:hypothetical protein